MRRCGPLTADVKPAVTPHPLLTLGLISALLAGLGLGLLRTYRTGGSPISLLVCGIAFPVVISAIGAYRSSASSSDGIGFIQFALAAGGVTIAAFFVAFAIALVVGIPFRRRRVQAVATSLGERSEP